MGKFDLNSMITIDDHGNIKKPTIEQLQNKYLLKLYTEDRSFDKSEYIKKIGVVYYMGFPTSPPKLRGLSDEECLKEAIENYDLPKTYKPCPTVSKLINLVYAEKITEAGVALEALNKSIHLVSIAANRINNILAEKLTNVINEQDIGSILTLIDSVSSRVKEVPQLTKSLAIAYENLRDEEETQIARGKTVVLSSMDADED